MNTTKEIITTPESGTGYLHDANLDTQAWIAERLGKEVEPLPSAMESDEDEPEWDHDMFGKVQALVNAEAVENEEEPKEYVRASRDNVYNHENDFSDVFTYTIYVSKEDHHRDWIWNQDAAFIAICLHKGGDVRGNYGMPKLYRLDDSIGDSNFLYWVIGWYVVNAETGDPVDNADRFSVGYASNPGCELAKHLDNDDKGEWIDGAFHAEMDGVKVICHPSIF